MVPLQIDDGRADELDEAWVPVLTPDGRGYLAWTPVRLIAARPRSMPGRWVTQAPRGGNRRRRAAGMRDSRRRMRKA